MLLLSLSTDLRKELTHEEKRVALKKIAKCKLMGKCTENKLHPQINPCLTNTACLDCVTKELP